MKLSNLLFVLVMSLVMTEVQAENLKIQSYEDPPNACYEGCTPWMEKLLAEFETNAGLVKLEPTFYSGECRHLSDSYDGEHAHYAAVMIDNRGQADFFFATQFVFFAEENIYRDWNLEKARTEMSDYWKQNGNIIRGKLSTRVEINYEDGSPAYIYWMRQNPQTHELYYITYAGIHLKSFCRLQKHN